MFVLRMPNERKMGVKDQREIASHPFTLSVSFRAKRGTSRKVTDHTQQLQIMSASRTFRFGVPCSAIVRSLAVYAARDDNVGKPDGRMTYSVRQKSWNRSRPFLMTSMLVA